MSSMSFRILRQGSNYTERPRKARLKRKVKENHNLFFPICAVTWETFSINPHPGNKKSRPEEAKADLDQIIKQAHSDTCSQSKSH